MQSIDRSEELTPIQNSTQTGARNSGSTVDKVKTTVADKLHAAADTIRQKSGENRTAGQAADWLHQAADYVQQVEPDQIKSDIQQKVRSNPGRSLLIASAAGLALGMLLRRR